MTDERKSGKQDHACLDGKTCMGMMKMMSGKGMGCDCSEMMSRMAKMDLHDDEGWAEMMKMCCSTHQEDKETRDQTNPV